MRRIIWARAVTNRLITECFQQTRYYNSVLIIHALEFHYRWYPSHVVPDYLLGKTSHYTCRGHKRSGSRERYPSPIQASLSCCASSKGHTLRNTLREQALREDFRMNTCFARGRDTGKVQRLERAGIRRYRPRGGHQNSPFW